MVAVPAGQPAAQASVQCTAASAQVAANGRADTLFVHPGMLSLSAHWDRGLAVASGQLLVRDGYAARIVELDGRDPESMVPLMVKDPGSRFIGLHYSMGGRADLVARSVAATRKASLAAGRPMAYYPILVDPAAFRDVGSKLDMNSPYLGQMFVMVSAEHAVFRTDIQSVARKMLDHPKTHLIYAEDFGLEWGHFDVLSAVTAAQPDDRQQRTRAVFMMIAGGINAGASPAEMTARLNALKVRYARADHRAVYAAWLPPQPGSRACGAAPAHSAAVAP